MRNFCPSNHIYSCQKSPPAVWREVTISVFKQDADTGAPLAGAVIELIGCQSIYHATTDAMGSANFTVQPCQTYCLREAAPPPGYPQLCEAYKITVDAFGKLFVNDERATHVTVLNRRALVSFNLNKVDSITSAPLEGAHFALYSGETQVQAAISDTEGIIRFTSIPVGSYTLYEITPPPGYLPGTRTYTVTVLADGTASIDGAPAQGYTITNGQDSVAFTKADSFTEVHLAGARFQLRQNGSVIGEAVSDSNGFTEFKFIQPGRYQLVETTPPPGYILDPTVHDVEVDISGDVYIDGVHVGSVLILNTQM